MFIVWGTKAVETRLGTVADFCPICRDARPFSVTRIGKAGHVYGVSVGQGEFVANIRSCDVCSVLLNAEPERYAGMIKRPGNLPFQNLKEQTFPTLEEFHGKRLHLEAAIREQPASVPVNLRNELMLEPFMLFGPMVKRRFDKRIDGYTGLVFILASFLLFPLGIAISRLFPGGEDNAGIGALLGIGLTLALTTAYVVWSGRNFMNKKIYPYLARSLSAFNPGRDEVRAIIQHLRSQGETMGKHVKIDMLMGALAEQPQRAG